MFLDVPGAKLFASRNGRSRGRTIAAIGGWTGSSELWQAPLALPSDLEGAGRGPTLTQPAKVAAAIRGHLA